MTLAPLPISRPSLWLPPSLRSPIDSLAAFVTAGKLHRNAHGKGIRNSATGKGVIGPDPCCCYKQAHRCDDNTAADIWMTTADASTVGPIFTLVGDTDAVCYYFVDAGPPGTLYTPADVDQSFASCSACLGGSTPPGCGGCVTVPRRVTVAIGGSDLGCLSRTCTYDPVLNQYYGVEVLGTVNDVVTLPYTRNAGGACVWERFITGRVSTQNNSFWDSIEACEEGYSVIQAHTWWLSVARVSGLWQVGSQISFGGLGSIGTYSDTANISSASCLSGGSGTLGSSCVGGSVTLYPHA